MKKNLFAVLLTLFSFSAFSQIVINEIMYNPPEKGEDMYEYLELYNNSDDTIQLLGYEMVDGIKYKFSDYLFAPDSYLVLARDSMLITEFGVNALIWDEGGLKNSGEALVLADSNGTIIDSVKFDDGGDWVTEPDGNGPSLELCDASEDNSQAKYWKASTNKTGIIVNDIEVLGTPGMPNSVDCIVLPEPDVVVYTDSSSFNPSDITVNVGDIVQWENKGGNHNVNGSLEAYPDNPEGFFSGEPSDENWIFQHQFNKPGVYDYHCDLHLQAGMKGTVTVLDDNSPSLVITEIMYNDSGDPDSIEFVEIYNASEETIDLSNYRLTSKTINYSVDNYELYPNKYITLAKYPEKIKALFGVKTLGWGAGGLSNGGDTVRISDSNNTVIDIVVYDDDGDWPDKADGRGYSLSLCDPNSDNNIAANWQASLVPSGKKYLDKEIYANPGSQNYCEYPIDSLKNTNDEGVSTSLGLKPYVSGYVHGINYNPAGLQFTVLNQNGKGVWIYSSNKNFGYTFNEGDHISVWGKINQYKGLTQIYPDSMIVNDVHTILEPIVSTVLDETTEGNLVKIENVHILDYSKWTNEGSGFNVEVSNGIDTFTVRIDKDSDIFGKPHPFGTFSITGIGGQYDSSKPYTSGYQLLPRYISDINPYLNEIYPFKNIGEVTKVDDNGVALSIDEFCELRGTVYGINYSPSGLLFVIIDNNQDGISVFNQSDNFGYNVEQGDLVSVKGAISQFNGMLQIKVDSISLINKNNELVAPEVVTELNENTEAQLIKIENLSIKDPTEWKGDGSSFNVTVTNGTDEFTMRIDNDVDLAVSAAPDYKFNLTGLGWQYDPSEPYFEGYQILPRYSSDLEEITPTIEINNNLKVKIYPNPSSGFIHISTNNQILSDILIYNIKGQKVLESSTPEKIDINSLSAGVYSIKVSTDKGLVSKTFVKE